MAVRRFGFLGSLIAAPSETAPDEAVRAALSSERPAGLRPSSASRPAAGRPTNAQLTLAREPRERDLLQAERSGAAERLPFVDIGDTRFQSLPLRERSLAQFLSARDELREALTAGPGVEIRAAAGGFFFSAPAILELGVRDAAEALAAVNGLNDSLRTIFLHDLLQFLPETRQFLGACFAKLRIGGTLIVTVPHQFLYERKLRPPSRRNPMHRRFYTANTLLADIEEAIDPCEYRIRLLGENDAGYEYISSLGAEVEGGQDIVLALEKLPRPAWRAELDLDTLAPADDRGPEHVLRLESLEPGPIRVITPDRGAIKRIVILKLDHRGDFLLATEAFQILRETYRAAHITLVCGAWNVAGAESSGFFDKVVAFDFFPEDSSAGGVIPSPQSARRRCRRFSAPSLTTSPSICGFTRKRASCCAPSTRAIAPASTATIPSRGFPSA